MNATAMLAVAASASCTTPRARALETPAAPAAPATAASDSPSTTPIPSDYVDGPHRATFMNGTVTVTFGPGAPVMIAGDSQIQPDEGTRHAIGVSGVEEVTGAFELCSDGEGVPFKVTIIRSTQYISYDQAIDEGVRRWRFIPRELRGKYVPSCVWVQLTYRPWRR